MIGADNTPKETKNGTVLAFKIWLLAILKETRLWSVRSCFLLVGHTHDALDRFFSRLCAALKGRDYFTMSDLAAIVNERLTAYQVEWQHLGLSFDWKHIRTLIGVEAKRLRNIHDFEVFRVANGIHARWRQYMTDEQWSRPVLLVNQEQLDAISRMRPPDVPHSFSVQQKNEISNWLDKLDLVLASNEQDVLRKDQMTWLRNTVLKGSDPGPGLPKMVFDLQRVGSGLNDALVSCDASDLSFPSDLLYQVAPGHDVENMPVQTLISLEGVPDCDVAQKAYCGVGDFIAVKSTSRTGKLPFAVGRLIDISPDSQTAIVSWWQPGSINTCQSVVCMSMFAMILFTHELQGTRLVPKRPISGGEEKKKF